jgi:hypothetical protein
LKPLNFSFYCPRFFFWHFPMFLLLQGYFFIRFQSMLDDVSVDTLQVFSWSGEDIFVLVQELHDLVFLFGGKMSPYGDCSIRHIIQVHFLVSPSDAISTFSLSRLAST